MNQLDRIRAFLRVAETGSVSEAARQLAQSKSVLSTRIAKLEAELGTPLLMRSSRRVRLTEAGELYAREAAEIVAQLDALDGRISSPREALTGIVRISCPTSLGILHLGELLSSVLCSHRGLRAEFFLLDRLVNPAEEGFDLTITTQPFISGQFPEEPLVNLQRVIVASASYIEVNGSPTEPSDLEHHFCVHDAHYESGLKWRVDRGRRHVAVPIRPHLTTNSGLVMRAAALAGQGIAIVPRFMVSDDLRAGRLLELLRGWQVPMIRVKAVFPHRRRQPERVTMLLRAIRRKLEEVAAEQDALSLVEVPRRVKSA